MKMVITYSIVIGNHIDYAKTNRKKTAIFIALPSLEFRCILIPMFYFPMPQPVRKKKNDVLRGHKLVNTLKIFLKDDVPNFLIN